MNVGGLRTSVVKQTQSATKDAAGQALVSWADVLSTFAEIRDLQGRELEASRQISHEVTTVLRMRYNPVSTGQRFVAVTSGTIYDVKYAIDRTGRGVELFVYCSRGANAG